MKKIEFIGPKRERKQKDEIDLWVAKNQETCLFCGDSLMKQNYTDCVKDHCHITGKYRSVAHNSCNLKLRIKPKIDQIPVVFHNLRGYDAHHLMQAMSQLQREVKCVTNNMEKYITFSVGGRRFIDSLNFLLKKQKNKIRAQNDSLFFAHDRSIAENKSCCFSHFTLCITSGFLWWKKDLLRVHRELFFVKLTLVKIFRPKTHKKQCNRHFYLPV